jgi:hypothetical protein
MNSDLMTLEQIQERLAHPQPLRIGELAAMSGLSAPTIRKLIEQKLMVGVHTGLRKEKRVPVPEARRVLGELRILETKQTPVRVVSR